MKILMVISQFNPIIGGAERQAQLLSETLKSKGIQIQVVTGRWKFRTRRREIINGIPVFRNFSFWGMFGIRYLRTLGALTYMISLCTYLLYHRKEYDIIHVHQALYPAFVSVWIGKRVLKKPVIVKTASSGMTSDIKQLEKYPLGKYQVKFLIKTMGCLVSNSKAGGDDFREIGFPGPKIVFIPNGVEVPIENKNPFGEVKHVMAVARLSPEKGIDVLLKAWAKVSVLYPTIKLIIAGQGLLESSLKKLCQNLRLTDSVKFVGLISNLNEYFRNTDLFVLPSRTEGLSNALLEAMSYGLPCIATQVGGNPELLGGGDVVIQSGKFIIAKNGSLVNPDDPKGLSEAMLYLMRNHEERQDVGRKSREFITENYSIDSVADRYIALYRSMLNMKA